MDSRSLYTTKENSRISVCEGASGYVKYAMPIVSEGDVIGSVACVTNEENPTIDNHSTEAKLIQTAASFLGRQFEG